MSAMNLGWCEKSASIMMTKLPVANYVDLGCAEAEFASARPDLDAGGAVDLLDLLGDFLRAIGGSIIGDD